MTLRVETVRHPSELGREWDPLFANGPGLQSSRIWFEASIAAALPPGTIPHIVTVRTETPLAILPLQTAAASEVTSLTTPYTTLYQPLLAPNAPDPAAIGQALGRHLRRWPLLRLEALDATWPGLPPLLAGFRRAGLVPLRYDHFGNWSEPVAGLTWSAYLAARPGPTRETVRRRGAQAARDPSIRFRIVRGRAGLELAMAAYAAVYARSWKQPEPFPHFDATLLPLAADAGTLRLAVLWQGDSPLAAQYWSVAQGTATVLKLAHDEEARALSPGTLLTAHCIRTLIDDEAVTRLDFGRGDDPYKRAWASERRQRIGLLLANPRRPDGLLAIARQTASTLRRTFTRDRKPFPSGKASGEGPDASADSHPSSTPEG